MPDTKMYAHPAEGPYRYVAVYPLSNLAGEHYVTDTEGAEVAQAHSAATARLLAASWELRETLVKLLAVSFRADEVRLALVASATGTVSDALHDRCDLMAEATQEARALLERIERGGV